MNLIVNAHDAKEAAPVIKAIALRVRDAGQAWAHAPALGAWEMPTRASAMELNIPGIHGVGDSLIYFVDRYRDFSIYDVDFVYEKHAERNPPAVAGLHYFGVVQSIYGAHARLGRLLPQSVRLLGAARGKVLRRAAERHAARKPVPQVLSAADRAASLARRTSTGRSAGARRPGRPDVPAATRALQNRGVVFVDRGPVQPSEKGALAGVSRRQSLSSWS